MSAQYFAQIDDNNVVTHVAVVQRDFLQANPERYAGRWIETFIGVENHTYAGVGYTYDETAQDFIAPVYVAPVLVVPIVDEEQPPLGNN